LSAYRPEGDSSGFHLFFSVSVLFSDRLSQAVEDASQKEDAMKSFVKNVRHFLVSEDGPTAVEYAVMLALIIVVCLVAITGIGTQANATFDTVRQNLGGSP
jgi:pilus assembly protein Flp/PilA